MNQPEDQPGIVADCMVFVQATANAKGPAARVLDLLDEGKIRLYVSKATLAEIRYVLNREELRASIKTITDVAVEALFQRLDNSAILIRQVPKRFTYPRDPKDEPYVNLALAAGATYIVSRDNDLLDLMRWDTVEGRDFQRRFRTLKIVDPVTFLNEIEQQPNTTDQN